MPIFPLFSCDWARWMVTCHGRFFFFSSLLLGVTTWKLKIRLKVRKMLKSEGKRKARETDWRWNHRKEEENEAEEGRKRIRGWAPAGRKRFAGELWSSNSHTQPHFHLNLILKCYFSCCASLFSLFCSLSYCKLIWLVVSDTVQREMPQRLLVSPERFKRLWLRPVEWE